MPDSASGDEEARLREAYRVRGERQADARYDPLAPSGRWGLLESERILLQGLSRVAGDHPRLRAMDILEVGCGRGGNLIRLAALGVPPERLHGIDLIPARIAEARQLHAGIDFQEGNAAHTAWPDRQFDVILQWVCLSSVLDPETRRAIGAEMLRLLRPGGAILSFDFVWNPRNRDTIGIPLSELRRIFPRCTMEVRRVYLAPPIARPLAPLSWPLTALLAAIPWLCLHRLAVIRPA